MTRASPIWGLWLAALLLAAPAVRADEAADKAAITVRLRDFADAFNARDAARACEIFAPDLVATVPNAIESGRASLCGNLERLLARRDLELRYDYPDIREIIFSGDLAIVRIVWTLTVRKGAEQDATPEAGIDVFRRGPDGSWSIARFATFTLRPNRLLD